MKIIMRGGFRREDDALADARRRLQDALGLGVRPDQQQQPQQQQGSGAAPFRVGNAAAAALSAAAHQQPPQVQLPSLSSLSAPSLPSLQHHLASHRETQHPQAASLLQERQLAVQRVQLEAQLQAQAEAQAQAQAQLRVRALLEQEAETEEQIRLLQARQRQRQQDDLLLRAYGMSLPSVASGPARAGAPSALDRLSGTSDTLSYAAATARTSLAARPLAGPAFGDLGSGLPRTAGLLEGSREQSQRNLPNAAVDGNLAGQILRLEPFRTSELALQMQQAALPTVRGLSLALIGDEFKQGKEEEEKQPPEDAPMGDGKEEDVSDDEYFRINKNPRAARPEKDNDPNFKRTREAFPLKLYRILHEAEKTGQADIISFFPHGRAFAVHKPKDFIRDIMPKYFAAGRMNTFLKQLNLYAFRRITEGPEKGGYFHPLFVNKKREQCKQIRRKKTNIKAAPPSPDATEHERQSPTDLTKLFQGQSVLSSPSTQMKAAASLPSAFQLDAQAASSDDEEEEKEGPSPPRYLKKTRSSSSSS